MRIVAGGVGIEVDDQGPPAGEPLLLIMGLGMPLVAWPQDLVQLLVSRGFRVVRMDNRDAGLSQQFDHLGVPALGWVVARHWLRLPVPAPYRIADMAADALGVLDALGIAKAHVCGASMGGMIAQHLAAEHPQRVRSLTLIMTTSGARHLEQPAWSVLRELVHRPAGGASADIVARLQRTLGIIGSPAYPADSAWQHDRLQAMVQRAWNPAGVTRQLVAVVADGDRSALLAKITAPTRVIHGEADPLVPVAAARDLAARIGGAVADIVPGMGHDLPVQLLPRLADGIAENARRAAA
jgi:pimeloyl-ACP methyl ester carboxylesterase